MKKLFVLSIICLFSYNSYASAPDLVGLKANAINLAQLGNFDVKKGERVLGGSTSLDTGGDFYKNAIIVNVEPTTSKFIVSSNSSGIITNCTYYFKSSEEGFTIMGNHIINLENAKFVNMQVDAAIYSSSYKGIKRIISFSRNSNGDSIIDFSIAR